jgi:hypothetical protein
MGRIWLARRLWKPHEKTNLYCAARHRQHLRRHGIFVLQNLRRIASDSGHSEKYALECLRMAADCKQLAAETTDPTLTAHFVRMSEVWAGLADSEPLDSEPK